MENKQYDVLIIGAGPGGLTAAIYASRTNLKTIFIDKGAPGGKLVKTYLVENWTGDISVEGTELALRMFKHGTSFGAEYKYGEVVKIENKDSKLKIVHLKDGQKIETKNVIIASGMVERVPEQIEGIREFENRGVYYCATCDGPLFKEKNVAVIGGGNSAIEESIFLANFVKNVYIFIRQEKDLIADAKSIDEAKSKKNITFLINSEIKKLIGNDKVEKAEIIENGVEKELEISAVFPYIGHIPETNFLKELNILDDRGFIITDENMETKVEGIYAIGDVRQKHIRQISTAVSDGTIAAKIITNKI